MSTARKIIKNIFSLSAAEIAKQGLMLVTTMYLARAISDEGYGIIGFAKSFTAYFVLFVTLGFDTLGTREVAKDHSKINKYVNSIVSIRIILSIIAYAALAVIVLLIDKPDTEKFALLIAGIAIFANVFLLNWVFQGLEKMEIPAIRQVITSLLNFLGVIIFVNNPDHTLLAIGIWVGSLCVNSLWMIIYYIKKYGPIRFDFDWPFWKELTRSAISIGIIFTIVVIYNNLNMVMLGFMASNAETGYYFAAFNILLVASVPATILQGAFFPNFSRRTTHEDRDRLMKKYATLIYMSGTIVTFSLFTFAEPLVTLAFGSDYVQTPGTLRILMVGAMFIYMSMIYFSPLIAWGMERQVILANLAGGATNIIANFILIPIWGVYGAATAAALSEFMVLAVLIAIFYKTMHKLYLGELIKFIPIAAVSCGAGYLLMQWEINAILSGTITLLIFALLNFAFKTITISEIREYLKK
ncbi:MAG: flippase [Candidatus Kapaibacterium sp.]